ncbi:MAG: DUF2625 domain-containing protein [Butyrivibrio sp.]|nr:DUF2625 domain-containing protein [Muribaculum sp.]MCM1552610.1 DUF2625 domain-containing protein [Butyrivibrio sp.]
MNNFSKILEDIHSSPKAIRVLPSDNAVKERIAEQYEINPESLLGLLLGNAGGIIIDNWLRLYGAGEMDFVSRNSLFPFDDLVVAEDILGGLFVYLRNGNIGYFAPDCLEFEDMEIHFNQFLYWCIHGDTDTFYADYRWEGWQEDCLKLNCDDGVAFYPFLWAQAENIESRTRRIVPMKEIIGLEFDFLRQMDKI